VLNFPYNLPPLYSPYFSDNLELFLHILFDYNQSQDFYKMEMIARKKLTGYDFYKSIGSPKFICAPMVDQSELPFRLLVRKYGCDLAYTPMINTK